MSGAGDLLAAARRSRGVSAGALSVQAGLSRSYLSKIEDGTCRPSVRALGLLARALCLSPHEVFWAVMAESA